MPSLKDLRNRITSVKATQKITKAMQMVAAAKLRRAQIAAESGRPYAEKMASVAMTPKEPSKTVSAWLGIRPPESAFTQRVSTANGTALTAPIRLDSITVGPITERNVDAMVSRPGVLTVNLLGQSFLGRLSGYEVKGDRLILTGR